MQILYLVNHLIFERWKKWPNQSKNWKNAPSGRIFSIFWRRIFSIFWLIWSLFSSFKNQVLLHIPFGRQNSIYHLVWTQTSHTKNIMYLMIHYNLHSLIMVSRWMKQQKLMKNELSWWNCYEKYGKLKTNCVSKKMKKVKTMYNTNLLMLFVFSCFAPFL